MEGWLVLCGLAVSALIGRLVGQTKNKPVRGAIAGFLLGPLGWLLIAVSGDEHPKCPHCRGNVVARARKCKNCGSHIPRCPSCRKQLGLQRRRACKHCGARLAGDEWDE